MALAAFQYAKGQALTTAQEERRRWDELKKLASEGNVQEFYRRYAAYLEWAGVYSESRAVLLKMAKAVAECPAK